MPTNDEIERDYKAEHDRITKAYCQEHSLSKADFDAQHRVLTIKLEDDLRAIGALPPKPRIIPEPDWKAL